MKKSMLPEFQKAFSEDLLTQKHNLMPFYLNLPEDMALNCKIKLLFHDTTSLSWYCDAVWQIQYMKRQLPRRPTTNRKTISLLLIYVTTFSDFNITRQECHKNAVEHRLNTFCSEMLICHLPLISCWSAVGGIPPFHAITDFELLASDNLDGPLYSLAQRIWHPLDSSDGSIPFHFWSVELWWAQRSVSGSCW